jgi:hypothetical protein
VDKVEFFYVEPIAFDDMLQSCVSYRVVAYFEVLQIFPVALSKLSNAFLGNVVAGQVCSCYKKPACVFDVLDGLISQIQSSQNNGGDKSMGNCDLFNYFAICHPIQQLCISQ